MAKTEIDGSQIQNQSITNDDVSLTAAIAGTKVSPNFGSQGVSTSGLVSAGTLKVGSSSTIGHVLTATDTAGNVAFAAPAAGVSYPLLANPIGTAGAPAYSFSGDTNTGVFSPEADSIAFSTAGTERLRLDASGNLKVQDLKYIYWGLGAGVRITGDVMNGWMLFQGNAGESSLKGGWFNTPAGFAHTGPTTSGTPYFSLNSSYTMGVGTSGADIIDLITASTKRLTIDATGRVGIGTTTPDRPLHIVGGMRADTILGVSSIIAGSGLQFSYDTILAMQSTNDIKFNTWGGVERMRVDHTTGFVWFAKGIRLSGDTSGSVSLQAPSVAGTQAYTLPSADGTSGQVLSTNGSGTLSWATASGGSDNHLNSGLADLAYSGITFTGTAGETLSAGDICYRKSDGLYWKADSSAAATMPGVALATAAITASATGTFLSHGFYRNDALYALTVGGVLYVSETAGGVTQTAPTTSGAQVQAIGYAYSADVVFFMPSLTTVGVA